MVRHLLVTCYLNWTYLNLNLSMYIICKKNILKYFEAFTFVFILEVYKKKISISKDEIVFFS
jgi:hypothetical protein